MTGVTDIILLHAPLAVNVVVCNSNNRLIARTVITGTMIYE